MLISVSMQPDRLKTWFHLRGAELVGEIESEASRDSLSAGRWRFHVT